jgi:hypothetical protein
MKQETHMTAKTARTAEVATEVDLDAALATTFPASDPVSIAQPGGLARHPTVDSKRAR